MLEDGQEQQQQQQQQVVTFNGQTYKVNDCVLYQGQDPDLEVGRIVAILPAPAEGGEQQLSLLRFLKPEHVLGGRQSFHGDKELIESDGVQPAPLSAVHAKARVFSLQKFQDLKRVGALDFFARFAWKTAREEFVPQRVPVYCLCEMPYNPDRFMVQCSACLGWYHPECLQCSVRALGAQATWQCPTCAGPAVDEDDDDDAGEDPLV